MQSHDWHSNGHCTFAVWYLLLWFLVVGGDGAVAVVAVAAVVAASVEVFVFIAARC